MPTQAQSGKAFEYALIIEAYNYLQEKVQTVLVEDATYLTAQQCFNLYNVRAQHRYVLAASAAIRHISKLEPRLTFSTNAQDRVELKLMPDAAGQIGDVRDILFIRSSQNWEIGISAKNNHMAVKHSRLSDVLDFGASWVGVPCSKQYFNEIIPVFTRLRMLKAQGELWRNIPDKHQAIYVPILNAFKRELEDINAQNLDIPKLLVSYLIGTKDFYKVIKRNGSTDIYGFNLNGTLNKSAGQLKPAAKFQRPAMPTEIVRLEMKQGSTDTLLMTLDKGWGISFRIHNAASLVEPSLKFDVNLFGLPHTLYSHNEFW